MISDGYVRCQWKRRLGHIEIQTPWQAEPLLLPWNIAKPDVGAVLWDIWAILDPHGTIGIATQYASMPVDDLYCHFLIPHLLKAERHDRVVKRTHWARFRSLAAPQIVG